MSSTQRKVVGWTLTVFTTFISTSAVKDKGYFSMKMPRNYHMKWKIWTRGRFSVWWVPLSRMWRFTLPLALGGGKYPRGRGKMTPGIYRGDVVGWRGSEDRTGEKEWRREIKIRRAYKHPLEVDAVVMKASLRKTWGIFYTTLWPPHGFEICYQGGCVLSGNGRGPARPSRWDET